VPQWTSLVSVHSFAVAAQFYETGLVDPKLWPFGEDLRARFIQTRVRPEHFPIPWLTSCKSFLSSAPSQPSLPTACSTPWVTETRGALNCEECTAYKPKALTSGDLCHTPGAVYGDLIWNVHEIPQSFMSMEI